MTFSNLLATPRVRALICENAFEYPYEHIIDPNGDVYMLRWWALQERDWCPYAARIHFIARADNDRHIHDHPYDFRSVILSGWYDEIDVFGKVVRRNAGDTYTRRAQEYHKIIDMDPAGVYTLFIYRHRKVSNPWGFLVPDADAPTGVRKVFWRDYLNVPA